MGPPSHPCWAPVRPRPSPWRAQPGRPLSPRATGSRWRGRAASDRLHASTLRFRRARHSLCRQPSAVGEALLGHRGPHRGAAPRRLSLPRSGHLLLHSRRRRRHPQCPPSSRRRRRRPRRPCRPLPWRPSRHPDRRQNRHLPQRPPHPRRPQCPPRPLRLRRRRPQCPRRPPLQRPQCPNRTLLPRRPQRLRLGWLQAST